MLKAMAADPVAANGPIPRACFAPDGAILTWLLDKGHRPDRLSDFGATTINSLIRWMSWELPPIVYHATLPGDKQRNIDSSRAREVIRMIHVLVAHGAKWLPADKQSIGDARRSFIKMQPDDLLEFAWLTRTYRAARRQDMEELIRTPVVARLLGNEAKKKKDILAGIPEDPLASPSCTPACCRT